MKNEQKSAQDNHANQLNQNNPAYWKSRGLEGVPARVTPPAQAPNPPSPQPRSAVAERK